MTRATDDQLPVFDRGGQGPLSNPDNEPSGTVGGAAPELASDDLTPDQAQAEHGRPDLPDETADGLDDTDEQIRRQGKICPSTHPGDDDGRRPRR